MNAMRTIARLVLVDLEKLRVSRRWLLVAAAWAVVCFFSSGQLIAFSQTTGLQASAWDVRTVAVNNWMYLSYLLLMSFVFLVGDTIVQDRTSGWSGAALPRVGGVTTWLVGKAVFLFAAALLFHIGFTVVAVAFGLLEHLPLGLRASEVATATVQRGMPFAPSPAGAAVLPRLAVSLVHEAFGFGAITLLVAAVTMRARRIAAPVAFVTIALIVDWVMAQRSYPWAVLSPGRRLIESVHLSVAEMAGGTTWAATFAYFAAIALVAALLGWRRAAGSDL